MKSMMKTYFSIVFGLILYINLSITCTIPSLNDLTVQTNFSLHDFLGSWYKIKWYKSDRYLETDLFNDYYQLFELQLNSTEHVIVDGKGRSNYEQECLSFGPWLIITNHSAKMSLEKLNTTSNTTNLNWPYWILKTDYHHYALIYSCLSDNNTVTEPCQHAVIAVFSRTVLLSNNYLLLLDDYIDDILCLSLTQFQIVLHSDKSCEKIVTNGFEIIDRRYMSFGFLLSSFYFFLLYK